MGRTGRREGQSANTTFFCQTAESVLQVIALIELAKSGWVERVEINDRCWAVLIHQLLAMALADDGVPREEAWHHLSRVPDFSGIDRSEFNRLIDWMIEDGSLLLVSGRLVLGPKAERRFGRRNFMELFAVFSSPVNYTVQTIAGQILGTLNQDFVDQLVEGVSCFILGGRAWAIVHVQHDDRRIHVEPAPRGKQPSWGGFLPRFLGQTLCQKIRDVLATEESFAYLAPQAGEVLAEQREQHAAIVSPDSDGIVEIGNEIHWWTFAGGRNNSTLRYMLKALGGDRR